MATVNIHRAKTHLSRLIEKACEGEEIIIACGDHPLVRLQPLRGIKGQRKPGSMKGKLFLGPEFFKPLSKAELASWDDLSAPADPVEIPVGLPRRRDRRQPK